MDSFTQFTTNPTVQKIARRLSLPLTLPTLVRRHAETDVLRPLLGRKVVIIGSDAAALIPALKALGAMAAVGALATWDDQIDAVVVDVDAIGGPHALFATLQPGVKKLSAHCRVILLTRERSKPTPRDHADVEAVQGFAKSLARELGQRAITVNTLLLEKGAKAEAVANAVSFFATDRPRYVSSQRIVLGKGGTPGGLSLVGEHAIVTGGARGIGASIARILARQGARVTIADLVSGNASAARLVAEIGPQAKFVAADVTKAEDVKTLFTEPATILINNAGITRDKTFAKMTQEQWDLVIAVNYEAGVRCTEAFLRTRDTTKPGSVVFLSSVVGISGNFGQTNYTLSKAAVVGYVSALAAELENVRVNAIAPGFIDTALTQEMPLISREASKQMIALLQAGEPEDIGEVAAFLAAPASAAINGQTVRVCGGMFMGA